MRVIAVLLVLAGPTLAQEGPDSFQPKPPAVGDTAMVKIDAALDLDIVTQDAQGTSPRQLSVVRSEEFSQQVVEVAEGARRDRIVCVSSKLQTSGTNRSPRQDPTDIHGRTFLLTRASTGRAIKQENGDPAPIDAAAIGAWDDALSLLPKGTVKEGMVWTVDSSALAGLINIADMVSGSGAFEVKLEKFADGEAVIAFTGLIDAKTLRGAALKLNITGGRFAFDYVKGLPRSLDIVGSLEGVQDIIQRIPKPGEIKTDEKVGSVSIKSRKLEVKVAWK